MKFYQLFTIGCDTSLENWKIYKECERKHEFVIKALRKWAVFVCSSTFAPLFFIPACYAIFEFPSPDHWQKMIPAK